MTDSAPNEIKITIEADPRLNPLSPDFDRDLYLSYMKEYQGKAPELRNLVKERIIDIITGRIAGDPDAGAAYHERIAEIRQEIQEAAENATAAIYETVVAKIENAPQQLALDGFPAAQAEFEAALDNVLETGQGQEQIESALQSIRLPAEIVRPGDKLTRRFFQKKMPINQEVLVRSGPDLTTGRGKNKTTQAMAPRVTISLLKLPPNISISREPSLWDDTVHTLVNSLFADGTNIITPDAIYRAYLNDPTAAPSEERRAEIEESLLRMMSTLVSIDTSGAMDTAYHINMNITENLISATRLEAEITNQFGTHKITAYKIKSKPLLMRYAETMNQVQRFSPKEFNTPVNKTTEIIMLQSALLDRIHSIPFTSNVIKYDSLFEVCNTFAGLTEDQAKRKKNNLRKYIHKMLNYWTETGTIKGWKEERQGRTVTGIVIITPQKALSAPNN